MMCPKCGCDIEVEAEPEEYEAEKGMPEMSKGESTIEVKEIDVPEDKQAEIKKKLAQIGKLLASVQD